MPGFQVVGTLYAKFDEQQIRSLRKREFILETTDNPQYPQLLKFDLLGERCDLVEEYAVGDSLEVYFNLKGREWVNQQGNKVYFTTLEAWKILKPNASSDSKSATRSNSSVEKPFTEDLTDEIPF
jgi:hypothetical protein